MMKTQEKKILIANNSLAALKFILSLKKEKHYIKFYGLVRKEDLDSTFVKYLENYQMLESGLPEKNLCDIENVINISKKFNVDFIWPGWGYLSENCLFSKACKDANINFIGPSYEAMKVLGDKMKASQLCVKLKIPVIPFLEIVDHEKKETILSFFMTGLERVLNFTQRFYKKKVSHKQEVIATETRKYIDDLLNLNKDLINRAKNVYGVKIVETVISRLKHMTVEEAEKEIFKIKKRIRYDLITKKENTEKKQEILDARIIKSIKSFVKKNEFPLLLKITQSGGGKGIYYVKNFEEIIYQTTNVKENRSSMILCKIIKEARHIELQMARDKHGFSICLGARDCSIQRRHQKMIEETLDFNNSFIKKEIISSMIEDAHKLMNKSFYEGVATVEFLYTGNEYYFLEVNTRIQVEHPVTELHRSINIPLIQYNIARGLSISNVKQTNKKSHVLAVRLIAEDPSKNFMPVTGNIKLFFNEIFRGFAYFSTLDGNISEYNDSQFGHIFVKEKNRAKCIKKMIRLLQSLSVYGINTNKNLLLQILNSNFFRTDVHKIDTLEKIIAINYNDSFRSLDKLYNNTIHQSLINFSKDSIKWQKNDHKLKKSITSKNYCNNKVQPYVVFMVSFIFLKNEMHAVLEFIFDNCLYKGEIFRPQKNRLIIKSIDTYEIVEIIEHNSLIFIKGKNWCDSFHAEEKSGIYKVYCSSSVYEFRLNDQVFSFTSPSDGKICKFFVKTDDLVTKGQNIFELETMKVKFPIVTEFKGQIKILNTPNIYVKKGDLIAKIYNKESSEYKIRNIKFQYLSEIANENFFEWEMIMGLFENFDIPVEWIKELKNFKECHIKNYNEILTSFYKSNHVNEKILILTIIVVENMLKTLEEKLLDPKSELLVDQLHTIEKIIVKKKINPVLFNIMADLRNRLYENRFLVMSFKYHSIITDDIIQTYLDKSCWCKESIFYSLTTNAIKYHDKLIKKALYLLLREDEKNVEVFSEKLYYKFYEKDKFGKIDIKGIFYFCKKYCAFDTCKKSLSIHFNCKKETKNNILYVNTTENVPFIVYHYNNRDYYRNIDFINNWKSLGISQDN